jgi:protein involved in polysaccharide export with SLBB domain
VKFAALLLAVVCGAAGQETGPAAYTLGPDDQIVIRVLDLEEFGATTTATDKPYRIDLRGFVNLPLVGRMKAGGRTIET